MTKSITNALATGIWQAMASRILDKDAKASPQALYYAEAAIAHLSDLGYVIAPREPTEAMMRAPECTFPPGTSESIKQSWRDAYGEIWSAMLSALPDKENGE